MTADEAKLVRYEVREGIATITLDSASNRNALSGRLISQVLDALDAAVATDDVHAIVLTGEGPVFCSGADLSDPPSNASGSRFSYPDVLAAMLAAPKPVIARVNGHARAGGLGLIAASDIAIAPASATFAFTEVRLGLVPAIIAVVCRRVMTQRSLQRLAMVGETFAAADAVANGLLTAAYAPESFDAAFDALIADVHRTEPISVARTKALLDELSVLGVADGLAHAAQVSVEFFDSAAGREGVAAFREKRSPIWAW